MKSVLLILGFLTLSTVLYSQVEQKKYDFENKILQWQKEYNVEFVAIGIIENGQIEYTKVFHKLHGATDSIQHMQFDAASLTKPVFANAVLQLIDSNILDLDERIYPFGLHSEIKNIDMHKKLTVRHVLSHQSGLPNWRYMTLSGELDFYHEPGSRYTYSGEGYEYLREILDLKLGASIQDYIDSLVFKPAEMYESKIGSAAGGMNTTIHDYTKFCKYIMEGAGITNSLYSTMHKNHTYIKPNMYYGLGWEVSEALDKNNNYAIFHSGAGSGVKNFTVIFPKDQSSVTVFTKGGDNGLLIYENIVRSLSESGNELFNRINKQYAPERQIIVAEKKLEDYVGQYQLQQKIKFNIFIDKGNLRIELMGQDLMLFPISKDEFIANESTSLRFIRDDAGKIESLIIGQYGIDAFSCKKLANQ
ncbi:serine hydrolase domain-containing protein [Reichenbachiella sp. MALMAid0571]|uniref:serine hydrolase domain-containing protein n=1 Tax=Reichenbachiella sp. MALMAid0571 TaxID=3143939 RepID=UPI0032DF46E4